jgi:hypothetical protein
VTVGVPEHVRKAQRLRGLGLMNEFGMPDRIGMAPREGKLQVARETIGHMLDEYETLCCR